MITIKATKRTKEVLIGIKNVKEKHKRGLGLALMDVGSEVVDETRRLIINGPKTGKLYKTGWGVHQASDPGEPPAARTGKLHRSAGYAVKSWNEMTVGESASYAGILEGQKKSKRIKPRPHLIVAVRNKSQETVNIILDAIKREIKT